VNPEALAVSLNANTSRNHLLLSRGLTETACDQGAQKPIPSNVKLG